MIDYQNVSGSRSHRGKGEDVYKKSAFDKKDQISIFNDLPVCEAASQGTNAREWPDYLKEGISFYQPDILRALFLWRPYQQEF